MIDYENLWNEVDTVVKEKLLMDKQPHEKTFSELARQWGKKTQDIITELLSDGLLGQREVRCGNGQITTVYYPIQKD